jgi:competence protein ComFB
MELHNIIEDIVISRVMDVFDTIEKRDSPEKHCSCEQCRLDTACYVLNRTIPFYIVSSRGAARAHQVTFERQQKEADITTLIYEGLKRVNHNQRPNFSHDSSASTENISSDKPVFNIPTITGRLFNGNNFAPISEVKMELYYNGALVAMKDRNWQNPLQLVSHTEGTFSFWPVPVLAEKPGEHAIFEYTLKVEGYAEEYEPFIHVLKIPVISEMQFTKPFALDRTFKLPDLYMFPPGEDEKNRFLDD